jgi:hypothetical protein
MKHQWQKLVYVMAGSIVSLTLIASAAFGADKKAGFYPGLRQVIP